MGFHDFMVPPPPPPTSRDRISSSNPGSSKPELYESAGDDTDSDCGRLWGHPVMMGLGFRV